MAAIIIKRNVCRGCFENVPEHHHLVVITDKEAGAERPIGIGFADENNNVLGAVLLDVDTALVFTERVHKSIAEVLTLETLKAIGGLNE